MKLDLTPVQSMLGPIAKRFFKHQSLIIVLFLSMGLIVIVLQINQIISAPTDQAYRTQKESSANTLNYDQATIKKIQQLNSRLQNNPLQLPVGQRINPFTE